MGIINLKVSLGTVNFNNWIHVSAAKVTSPSFVEWETWIAAPVTNYNFVIPGLDPQNYYITYYDAPTNTALGQLRMQLIVNALTNQYISERRFYVCGGAGANDPADGALLITDSYLVNKAVTGLFKENNRYQIPFTEWDTTSNFIVTPGDTISILTGVQLSAGEVIAVELLLQVGVIAAAGGSLYSGRVDVIDANYTLLKTDRGKRHRLIGTGSSQVINLPSIATMNQEDYYLIDASMGGTPVQPRILPDGEDAILFDGFRDVNGGGDEFMHEIWISRGKKIMLAVVDEHWEVILPWDGEKVGEQFEGTIINHPNAIMQNGQIGVNALDGDILPGLWWWLDQVHDSSYIISDATVILTTYVHPAGKEGYFVIHPTLKKFRTPNWQGMTAKSLKDYGTFGGSSDPDRVNNYPGGLSPWKMPDHRHLAIVNVSGTANTGVNAGQSVMIQNESGGIGDFKYSMVGSATEPTVGRTGKSIDVTTGAANGSTKNIVDNLGVIHYVRIG